MKTTTRARSFDPFRVLDDEERRSHLEAYSRFLEERDGDVDLPNCRLSRREAFFRELERKPVEWLGDTDLEGFHQHFRGTGTPPIDVRTLWILAAAKANLGEAYGVEIELARFHADPEATLKADPRHLNLMLEEHYHTRILGEVCRTCGLEFESAFPPPPLLKRILIQAMMYLPDRARWVLILAGETLGAEVFKLLQEGTHHFAEQPEVEERLRTLLGEVCIDEVFHVAYLRAKTGPLGIRIARWILPALAWSVMRDVPELFRLGWSHKTVVARIRRGLELPVDFEWMAPDPPRTT